MIRKYFNRAQEIEHKPSLLFRLILVLRNILISWFRLPGNPIDVSLFSAANKLSFGATPDAGEDYPAIEILFVTTKKDFEILVHSIRAAQESTSHHPRSTTSVLVPDAEHDQASKLLSQGFRDVRVLRESDFLTIEQMSNIRNRFGKRSGWVIQQLLKVEFVSRSQQMGVLIVDSDTLILNPRIWLDKSGSQLLTPTWEWHQPYYDFLENAGFEAGSLKQSFVSHHMLMQPQHLRDARLFLGWQNLDFLIEYLILKSDIHAQSPFCIEYELYAQFMLKFHPEKVTLAKWSNIGISRETGNLDTQIRFIKNSLSSKFASVSLHAYL